MEKYSKDKDYKVIAFCISKFHSEEQRETINYICKYAREYRCKIMIFTTLTDLFYNDNNDYGEIQIFAMLQEKAFDAVVIMSETFKKTNVDREIADRCIKAGVPVISVNRYLEGCTNIDFTYSQTFEAIVRHIIEFHECKKVNYIGGDLVSRFSLERFEAYKKVLKENNIPYDEKRVGNGYFVKQQALEVLDEFLKDKELPDAIICANDMMAIAVCSKLRSLGLKVPEDIIVTGFDGLYVEKYMNPRLTTAAFDWERTARTIFEVALDLAADRKVQQPVLVPYIRRLGHSCGCGENYVCSAVDRLLEEKLYQIDVEDYCQLIMNTSSRANKCDDLAELLDLAQNLSEKIQYKDYWLFFLEDSYQKIVNKLPCEIEVEQDQTSSHKLHDLSSAKVVMVSHASDCKNHEKQMIEARDMIPNMDELFEKEDYVMFVPMHLQGMLVGYMGITLDLNKVKFECLNLFIMNFRSIIETYWNRVAQEQLLLKDELTGLLNNKGFQKKTQQLFSKKCVPHTTLLVIAMDNLKDINENYGHSEGNNLLKQMGSFLEQTVMNDEFCARTDGDEFVIVSSSSKGRARAQEIQDAIERKVNTYNLASGKTYEMEVSIGYGYAKDADGLDFRTLYTQADNEAYRNRKKR